MRALRNVAAATAAFAWLGSIVVTTPIPFIHLVEWHGRPGPVGIGYDIIAACASILAIAAAISWRRWLALSSFILSLPAACWSFVSLCNIIPSLRQPPFSTRPPGVTAFLCLALAVALAMLCVPMLWGAVCFQLRSGKA